MDGETDLPANGGIGDSLMQRPFSTRSDAKLIKRARDQGWPMTDQLRSKAITVMERILDTSEHERNRLAAAKVLTSMDMVNVNRERMTQTDEAGPAPVPVTFNVQINGGTWLGMAQADRARLLQSGAQLAHDAIELLTPDELAQLTRASLRPNSNQRQ